MVSTHLKNISQIGNLSQDRDEHKKYVSCHHLGDYTTDSNSGVMSRRARNSPTAAAVFATSIGLGGGASWRQGTMKYTDWFRVQGSWFSGLGNNTYICIYWYTYIYIMNIGSIIIPYVQQTWSIVPSSTPNSFLISTYFLKLLHFLTNAKYYCWWKKSCTTWDVQNPVNNGISYYLSTCTGFPPSTGTASITIKGSCIEKDIRVAKT